MTPKNPLRLIQNRGTVDILITLLTEEKLNVSQLSEKSGVCSGTIQRRLKELKESELIAEKIRESENNRLEKAYRLTKTGEKISKILNSLPNICKED